MISRLFLLLCNFVEELSTLAILVVAIMWFSQCFIYRCNCVHVTLLHPINTYTRQFNVVIPISRSQQHLKLFCFCSERYALSFAGILRNSRRMLFVIRSGTQIFCTKSPPHVLRASELNYFYYAHLTVSCMVLCINCVLYCLR